MVFGTRGGFHNLHLVDEAQTHISRLNWLLVVLIPSLCLSYKCRAPNTCKQCTPQTTADLVVHGGAASLPTQPALVHAAVAMSSAPTNVVSKRASGGGDSPGSPWQLAIC